MIREMERRDSDSVLSIYDEAIKEGKSTFKKETPSWPDFSNSHLPYLRFVYEENGIVLGWITVSRIYAAPAYDGYLEESIYIRRDSRGKGIGKKMLSHLILESERLGIWGLYGCIFSTNTASIRLHESLGFRIIGERRKVAKDIYGKWQDTTLMERRSPLF